MGINSMSEWSVWDTQNKKNDASWFMWNLAEKGKLAALAALFSAPFLPVWNKVDWIISWEAQASTLEWRQEQVGITLDVTKNEQVNTVLDLLKLDATTKEKVLENIKKISEWNTSGSVTMDNTTWWSIEIYKEWNDIKIIVDEYNEDGTKWKQLDIKIQDPKTSANPPITIWSNGVSYEVNKWDTSYLAWVNSSWDNENARVAVASMITEKVALWLMVDLWPDMYRIIASIWFEVWSDGHLIFMWEHLNQKQDIATQLLWVIQERISQNKLSVEFKQKLSDWFVNYMVVRWYISQAESKELINRQFTIEDADYIRVYKQVLWVKWWFGTGLEWWIVFKLNEENKVEMLLDADRMDFGDMWVETWVWVKARFTTESLARWVKVYVEWWAGNKVTWNMVWAWISAKLDELGIKNNYDLAARVWVKHTMWWITENNTAVFAGITWSFWAWSDNANNLTKWERITRDIEWSSPNIKTNWSLTWDMLDSMEATATALIPVKVEEKTELVSSTAKEKPVVVQQKPPKPPENKEVPPEMWNIPDKTATNGTAFNWDISGYATQTNGDIITAYNLTWKLPTWITFDSKTWKFAGTPTVNWEFPLSVTAIDNDGTSNSDSFKIIVSNTPEKEIPPTMLNVPDQTWTVGTDITKIELSKYVTKTNSDAITSYAYTGTLPPWLTFDTVNWIILGAPTTAWTYNISVTALDNDWASNADAVKFVIDTIANNSPTANAWADITITAWDSTTLNWSGTDSDGTITAYEWSTWATTQSITVSPASTTTYSLRVKDNSWNWSAFDSVKVTVEAIPNQAPVAWNGSVDAWWWPSVNFDFSSLVSDDTTLDNQLIFEVVSNPANLIITWTFPNMTFEAPIWVSLDTTITYRVKDTAWVYSNTWSIDIININN